MLSTILVSFAVATNAPIYELNGQIQSRRESTAPSLDCPLPTFKHGKWICPDQKLTLDQRRHLFESMKPFDEINGIKLDEYWPATAGKTDPMANSYEFDYEGIDYKAYRLSRPTGERAPLHYHEVAQQLCLESGKILVMTQGEADKVYEAPDCYMMPAYTKVTVISLVTKVENCLLRVPHGGLDWVVIEPKYYNLQGQWTDNRKSNPLNGHYSPDSPVQTPVAPVTTSSATRPSLGAMPPPAGGLNQRCDGGVCNPGLECRTEYHGGYVSQYQTATCQYSTDNGGWGRPCNTLLGRPGRECDHWLQYCDQTQNPPRCIPFWGRW